MDTKREALRADRLACTGLALLGAGGTALAVVLPWDGSAVGPLLVVTGVAGLYRLRPTVAGRRARARRSGAAA